MPPHSGMSEVNRFVLNLHLFCVVMETQAVSEAYIVNPKCTPINIKQTLK